MARSWVATLAIVVGAVELSPPRMARAVEGGPSAPPSNGADVAAPARTLGPVPSAADHWTPALDEPLRRALVTGCVEGVQDLTVLASSSGTSGSEIAAQVLRLCADVRAPPGAPAPHARASDDDERGGRAQLVLGATLYGIWTGIALDVVEGVDGDRMRVLFPMLGLVAGLGGSLVATRQGGITGGQAWSVITGLDYGTYNGLLWSAATDGSTEKGVIGVALGAGLAGGAIGAVVVAGYHPPQGGVELVRSGGLYGTGVALLAALLIAPEGASSKAIFTTVAMGMDVGLAAGAVLATQVPISRNRVLLVDAGTIAGAGLGLGTTWLIAGTHGDARRALGAGGLIGMGAGMATAILLTRGLDSSHQAADAAPVPALATRDQAGNWRPGTLALVPVTASDNTRIIGASVPVVGGVW